MIQFIPGDSISIHILNFLIQYSDGHVSTDELFCEIVKRKKCTKQAFYLALQSLRKNETIVYTHKHVFLSNAWIKNLITKISEKDSHSKLFDIQEGEIKKFTLHSLNEAAAFWTSILLSLNERVHVKHPYCIYNPHQWFFVEREKRERFLLNKMSSKGQRGVYVVVGERNKHSLDLRNKNKQFSIDIAEKPLPNKRKYINVLGDLVMELRIDMSIFKQLDFLYSSDELNIKELEILASTKSINTFSFEKNSKKAKRLEKYITEHFIFS